MATQEDVKEQKIVKREPPQSVPCPDCGKSMKIDGEPERRWNTVPCCPQCRSAGVLVKEAGDVRHYRCPQERHRVRKSDEARLALYDAAVRGLKSEIPADSGRIRMAQVKFIEEPLKNGGKVLIEEPVVWDEKVQVVAFYHCGGPACRYRKDMAEQRVDGRKVEVDVGMRHKVKL